MKRYLYYWVGECFPFLYSQGKNLSKLVSFQELPGEFTPATGRMIYPNSYTSMKLPILFLLSLILLGSTLSAQVTFTGPILPAQVTFTIDATPFYYTPLNSTLYIAGDFNNWDPGVQPMTKNANGSYSVTLNIPNGTTVEYKYTRGSWPRVEGNAAGGQLANRSITVSSGMTVLDTVQTWEDLAGNHTAVGNTHILDLDFFMPQFNKERAIWIYLPQNYYVSNQNYPVLYMHDAQNLFDALYSFSGEWGIDESMEAIQNNGGLPAIVVGVENGQASRIDEYTPWVNAQYGGGDGEAYIDFLVNTLKPYIDANFRTRPGRTTTGIMGSSLGGLISHYAALERPDVFGKAGVFSPSFWFSDSAYSHTASQGHSQAMRIYMIAGDQESPTMVPNMYAMRDTLLANGFSNAELNVINHSDGQHSEWYWAREYAAAFNWLFADVLLDLEDPSVSTWKLVAHSDGYQVIGQTGMTAKLEILDLQGRRIYKRTVAPGDLVRLEGMAQGVYVTLLEAGIDTTRQKLYFHSR